MQTLEEAAAKYGVKFEYNQISLVDTTPEDGGFAGSVNHLGPGKYYANASVKGKSVLDAHFKTPKSAITALKKAHADYLASVPVKTKLKFATGGVIPPSYKVGDKLTEVAYLDKLPEGTKFLWEVKGANNATSTWTKVADNKWAKFEQTKYPIGADNFFAIETKPEKVSATITYLPYGVSEKYFNISHAQLLETNGSDTNLSTDSILKWSQGDSNPLKDISDAFKKASYEFKIPAESSKQMMKLLMGESTPITNAKQSGKTNTTIAWLEALPKGTVITTSKKIGTGSGKEFYSFIKEDDILWIPVGNQGYTYSNGYIVEHGGTVTVNPTIDGTTTKAKIQLAEPIYSWTYEEVALAQKPKKKAPAKKKPVTAEPEGHTLPDLIVPVVPKPVGDWPKDLTTGAVNCYTCKEDKPTRISFGFTTNGNSYCRQCWPD